MGPTHELHPQPGGGDGEEGLDLQLTSSTPQQPAGRQAAFFSKVVSFFDEIWYSLFINHSEG